MKPEELLGEVEDILRTMPPRGSLFEISDNNLAWLGRATAFVGAWDRPKEMVFSVAITQLQNPKSYLSDQGLARVITMLNQARHDLRMKTLGPLNTALGAGQTFDYFDELRQIIEPATQDLLFTDRYLDAEFVSRYLPHVKAGVTVRLLARDRLPSLLPAVELFAQQSGLTIQIRSAQAFHERWVFVDRAQCYQSGASFKDGAKNAPATLTQVIDAFPAVLKTYEDIWIQAKVER